MVRPSTTPDPPGRRTAAGGPPQGWTTDGRGCRSGSEVGRTAEATARATAWATRTTGTAGAGAAPRVARVAQLGHRVAGPRRAVDLGARAVGDVVPRDLQV